MIFPANSKIVRSKALLNWSNNNVENIPRAVTKKKSELNSILENIGTSSDMKALTKCKKELESLTIQEETHWRQRSKDLWLKEGDRNSKYFHQAASNRKRNNTIRGITDSHNNWVEDDNIETVFVDYFNNLFKGSATTNMEHVVNLIKHKIPDNMIVNLTLPYTEMELNIVLQQMNEGKSPGPNGMTMEFYKHHWDVIGRDITNMVLDILNNGKSVRGINRTDIALIPKKTDCKTPMDYRPISLCNVCYKLVSKMVVNRMKPVLPHIISKSQSVFVQGRSIFDNIIIAHEITHSMKKKRTGHVGFVGAKLDMAKAYNRLEWNFVKVMMIAMRFPAPIISIVMDCISTMVFSILINGKRTSEIHPERGVRQGDPLSSFLFIIAAEGMSALLDDAANRKTIHGFKVASTAPAITHLCFADDSIHFF